MRWPTVLLCVALAGCATAAPSRPSPLAKKPFVPVNLYINSDARLSSRETALTEYLAQRFVDSGAFLRVDRGSQRWAYTLQLRYRIGSGSGAGTVARWAGAVLSLGLLPLRVSQPHHLEAEVFLEPDPVGRLEYDEEAHDRLSLWGLFDRHADERAAADRLFERLTADLSRRQMLPAAKDPPRPRKDPGRSQSL